MTDAFESPLLIKVRTELTAVGFGAVEVAPEIAALRRELNEILSGVTERLPGPLGAEIRAVISGYCGDGDFYRLFYTPVWSFLHWAAVDRAPDAELLRTSRAAHALSLFLHLWDDHLCDGQLPLDLLRLHFRTLAWQRFASEGRRLCELSGLDPQAFDEHAAPYLRSLHAPAPVSDVDAYCRRFVEQVSIWTLVPRALGLRAGGGEGSEGLRRMVEDFAVAWRLLDDVQDVHEDLLSEEATAVWLELDESGRGLWAECRRLTRAGGELDAESWGELSAHIRERGCLDGLLSRIDERLGDAARAAASRGWGDCVRELEQCRAGLVTRR